jgi:hypothetical protein
MDTDRIFAQLAQETAEIMSGIREWRAAHPRATFAEIQTAVDERLNQVRARVLEEVAQASQAAAGADLTPTERPLCATCGERMTPKGSRPRTVLVQGEQTVTLTRNYWCCPTCEAALFPPG